MDDYDYGFLRGFILGIPTGVAAVAAVMLVLGLAT